ncbi:MAG: sigma-70 family RNA polymerase sigma factor [Bacteroidota bacterium]
MSVETIAVDIISADHLISRAQKGDEKAFNQLVNHWYKRIYNYVLKYCTEEDLATELAQKTFIAVFKNLKTLKNTESFKPWIYRIATNFCHEEARRQARNKMHSIATQEHEEEKHTHDQAIAESRMFNPERSFQQSELAKIVFEYIGELPDEQRCVVLMKEYEGFKFHEIAEALSTSENTVKTRLYRGLRFLKKRLEEQNITRETIHYEL